MLMITEGGAVFCVLPKLRKDEAMIARFDHRPMLTAALALATIVLLVVVVTLSALLITSQQAEGPTRASVGNPPAHAMGGGGGGSDFTKSPAIERHAEVVAAFNAE